MGAANDAISNNQFKFDRLESYDYSLGVKNDDNQQRQSCSSCSTMTTNSNSLLLN